MPAIVEVALSRIGSIPRSTYHAFAAENAAFITGVDGEFVRFGYTGQRTADIAGDFRVSDVQWLMRTLDALTPAQIADAVRASGGTAEDAAVFAAALRERLDLLNGVVSGSRVAAPVHPPGERAKLSASVCV